MQTCIAHRKEATMYEPTKHVATFKVAGVQHNDAAKVIGKLKVGAKVKMEVEPDNPYDVNAVVLSRKGVKLGYVPRADNAQLAQMLYYGHGDAFVARIVKVDKHADPWDQLMVGVFVKDARG